MLNVNELRHLDRLRYVKRAHPKVFRRLGNKKFLRLLDEGGHLTKRDGAQGAMSEATMTRILQSDQAKPWLERALLEDHALRANISKALQVEDLFSSVDTKAIDHLFSANADAALGASDDQTQLTTLNPVKRIAIDRKAPRFLTVSQERSTARKLKLALTTGQNPFVHWTAEPWSGATLAVRSLAGHIDLKPYYSEMVFLRCTDVNMPFLAEMRQLAADFGDYPSDGELPEVLAKIVQQERLLLVICDACHLPAKSKVSHAEGHPSRIFINQLLAMHKKGPARLLTIGRSQAMEEVIEHNRALFDSDPRGEELSSALRYTGSRFSDYRELETHYRAFRKIPLGMVEGNRLKRAKWHYETDQVRLDREVWPANLRLRAFFASNLNNFGYFDPTRGFEAMAGPRPWPEDIEILYDDIIGYLRIACAGARQSELNTLRYCSTALHWLTDAGYSALTKPGKDFPKGDVHLREVKRPVFEALVSDERTPLRGPVNKYNQGGLDVERKVFALSIGIKALVQDQWRLSEPEQRAEAHYRIGWRLWKQNQDKGVLREEFPYMPMQHRHSVFLAGEAVRHLMLAVGTSPTGAFLNEQGDVTERWHELTRPTVTEQQGCDPEEVVNFCYVEIFQRYINRNHWVNRGPKTGSAARALSKRHGAFAYAAELLQLMSHEGKIGHPHQALHPKFHHSFIRECGYALLDLGMLEQALDCFQRLDSEISSKIEKISAKFDEALVLAELGRLNDVWEALEATEEKRKDLSEQEIKFSDSAMNKRFTARAAHLQYLEGDYELALMRLAGAKTMTPEMIHIRLASMSCTGVKPEIIAAAAANEAYKAASGTGQHEAIGFMVANAHAVRKFDPDAAEELLETVLEEVLRSGCSERTLLRLLLEAARILAAQGRLLRAFSTYAYPCAQRARARGFVRIAATSEHLCRELLRRISLYSRAFSAKSWKRLISEAQNNDIKTAIKLEHGRAAADSDPLFGFFFDAPSPVLLQLEEQKGISGLERELRRNYRKPDQGATHNRLQISINRGRLAE